MKPPQQAIILCGGRGTRLRPFTDYMPKPMVPVNDRPFLEHLLEQLAACGISRFLLLTGYLGEQIRIYFGDGSSWGWEIEYSHGPVEWDTGRRLWEARQQMEPRFLLIYSDNFVQFPMGRLMALHATEQVSLSLLLAPKAAKGNIRVSVEGHIEAYDKTRTGHSLDFVEVGYMIVERGRVLDVFPILKNHPDFSFSEVLRHLAGINQLAGLVVRDPYHSISDPDRLELMRSYLKPKKILLIDRDGVINQKAPRGEYIRTWEGFKWIPETRQAMKDLAKEGFQFIVITNQAGIARKMVDPDDLEKIHQNMIEELSSEGVEVLKIYMSPHHWDEDSFMRKPSPGMFFQAAKEYKIRMDRCLYVGDDERDCQAAVNAGCGMVYVSNENKPPALDEYPTPYFMAKTLQDSVEQIRDVYLGWEAIA